PLRARPQAQGVEMVLADPSRVHAEPVGVQGFLGDVGDELVRRPGVVLVVIVAQGEVAEFHNTPPLPCCVPLARWAAALTWRCIIDAFAIVVNATDWPPAAGQHYAANRASDTGRPAFDMAQGGQ